MHANKQEMSFMAKKFNKILFNWFQGVIYLNNIILSEFLLNCYVQKEHNFHKKNIQVKIS